MHSEKSIDIQKDTKRSFIEEARRTQIIDAAIDVIAAQGYSQTSLAKIAEHAGISTSLIPYHFKDKDELMTIVLRTIVANWEAAATQSMQQHTTPSSKLRSYVEARLIYIGTHPKESIAMVDLLFSARGSNHEQSYRTDESGFELDGIATLLAEGQQASDFKAFNVTHMSMMIRSTIDQFLGFSQVPGIDLEQYVKDVMQWYGILITKKGTL
jgi:TetR/AcrR family transcriptional repressor of bet genes